MFELKTKIIKRLLVNGNKFLNEQKFKERLKNISKYSKKNHVKVIQIVINYSSYIFKITKLNKPFYFNNTVRIAFAIKQSLNFIKTKKSDILNNNLLSKNSNLELVNKKFNGANKMFYFYRWF